MSNSCVLLITEMMAILIDSKATQTWHIGIYIADKIYLSQMAEILAKAMCSKSWKWGNSKVVWRMQMPAHSWRSRPCNFLSILQQGNIDYLHSRPTCVQYFYVFLDCDGIHEQVLKWGSSAKFNLVVYTKPTKYIFWKWIWKDCLTAEIRPFFVSYLMAWW